MTATVADIATLHRLVCRDHRGTKDPRVRRILTRIDREAPKLRGLSPHKKLEVLTYAGTQPS